MYWNIKYTHSQSILWNKIDNSALKLILHFQAEAADQEEQDTTAEGAAEGEGEAKEEGEGGHEAEGGEEGKEEAPPEEGEGGEGGTAPAEEGEKETAPSDPAAE